MTRQGTALVTGASKDIGRAIAMKLASDGFDIAVHCKQDVDAAEEVASNLRDQTGQRAVVLQADLEDPDAIGAMFDLIESEFEHLDVYVANAAASVFRKAMDLKDYNVDRTFAISVNAFVFATQRAAAMMPNGGSVVAISGMDAVRVIDLNATKGAAKAALEALVRYFAWELGPQGIRVNAVRPGYIWSRAGQISAAAAASDYSERMARRADVTPLRRNGRPEDVAGAVSFLTSDASGFVTGQTIVVDGGMSMTLEA